MYRSTVKDEQIKVNEGYREEQNNTVGRSQQKENTNANENVTSFTKEEIENLTLSPLNPLKRHTYSYNPAPESCRFV